MAPPFNTPEVGYRHMVARDPQTGVVWQPRHGHSLCLQVRRRHVHHGDGTVEGNPVVLPTQVWQSRHQLSAKHIEGTRGAGGGGAIS